MILITGATGFAGSVLAKQLAGQNIPIRCIKRSTSVIPGALLPFRHLIEWRDADVLDSFALEDAFADVTQVYHCAARVSFNEAEKDAMVKTNTQGTANIVDLCLDNGTRLVHISSVAAIGKAKPGELITEKHFLEETAANHAYAVSKLESEMEVWRGIAEGLDAVIVNPSLIIGADAGEKGTGKIFKSVRGGLKYYSGGSSGLVDVEDVAKCMIALMNSDITAERFILNAENWSYQQLLTTIAKCFGVKPPASEAKPWMLELAWRGAALASFFTGREPMLDKVSARTSSQVNDYDNSKIKKAIGFEFKPLQDSVEEVCAAFAVH